MKEAVRCRNKADKDTACQQLAERGRKPPLFMMKFIDIPSRCDVITEKGRLSSCRLYKRVAHLGHCAAERKKALLGITEGSPPRTRVIFQCLCLSLPCREKDSQSLLSGYHTGPARTIAQPAPRLQNVLQKHLVSPMCKKL